MVLSLFFKEGIFVPLVDPDPDDDFNALIFQYLVIQAAMAAGATRYLPELDDPLEVHNIASNC